MSADFVISGLLRQDVVAVASCSAGKSCGDGHPSYIFIGVAIFEIGSKEIISSLM